MKIRSVIFISIAVLFALGIMFCLTATTSSSVLKYQMENKKRGEEPARFTELRAKYDFDMIKDPVTGKIPGAIFEQELAFARTLPEKGFDVNTALRVTALNTYSPAGSK